MTARALALGKIQSHHEKTLQGTNDPWQKQSAFYLTKLLFCRFRHNCRQKLLKTELYSAKAIHTKIKTKHYSLQCSDKSLFTLQYPRQIFQRMRLLSAKVKCNYQKQTTSCPDRKHLLLQISTLNYALKAYKRRYKAKQKAERIYYNSWEFSLAFILSFSFCILISTKLYVQDLRQSPSVSIYI